MNPRNRVNVILVSQNVLLCSGFLGLHPSQIQLLFISSLSTAELVFGKNSKFKISKFKSSLEWANQALHRNC